ncbi:hypothetical protein ACFX13_016590 [Malus domestica]
MPRRIDEVATRRSHEKRGSHNATEKVRDSNIQLLDSATYIKKQSWRLPLCIIPMKLKVEALKNHKLYFHRKYDKQDQAPAFGDDECITAAITVNGNRDICFAVVVEQALNLRKQEPMTEIENHLRQVEIKSHHFLNIAEALFKLDITFQALLLNSLSSSFG